MKKYFQIGFAVVILLVFVGTFVFLWQKSQPQPVEYEEYTVKTTDISKTTIITGRIEPRNEVNVKPQISGIISAIYKEAGETVTAGEVIAKVEVQARILVVVEGAERRMAHHPHSKFHCHVFYRDILNFFQVVHVCFFS